MRPRLRLSQAGCSERCEPRSHIHLSTCKVPEHVAIAREHSAAPRNGDRQRLLAKYLGTFAKAARRHDPARRHPSEGRMHERDAISQPCAVSRNPIPAISSCAIRLVAFAALNARDDDHERCGAGGCRARRAELR
jgi:hypothetical protein